MDTALQKTLTDVSEAYLEKTIKLSVDVAPANKWHAYFQKRNWAANTREFEIRPVKLGSLVKISRILLGISDGVLVFANPLASTYDAVVKHHRDIATIIAIAIVNREKDPPESLVRCIINNFSTKDILRCLAIVLRQMDITNFTQSIISVRGMNLLKVSPADQGSHIASGVQPKESLNTLDSLGDM